MLHIITGGSGSGKSQFAEDLLCTRGKENRYYLATMQIYDEEMKKKVMRHRQMREHKNFITVEAPFDLECVMLEEKGFVLLECISNLVANELYKDGHIHTMDVVIEKIIKGITHLTSQAKEMIVVTNEVNHDGVAYSPDIEAYCACIGVLNQKLVQIADSFVEVVYGIPIVRKGKNLLPWEELYEGIV